MATQTEEQRRLAEQHTQMLGVAGMTWRVAPQTRLEKIRAEIDAMDDALGRSPEMRAKLAQCNPDRAVLLVDCR